MDLGAITAQNGRKKTTKTEVNNARSRKKKKEAQNKYQEKNKEVKNSVRQDKRKYMQDLATEGEEAVAKGSIKELYNVSRQICGKGRSSGGPIKDCSGKLKTKHEDQMERWKKYFSTLLNQTASLQRPNISPASQQQSIDKLRASIQIRKAIKALRQQDQTTYHQKP